MSIAGGGNSVDAIFSAGHDVHNKDTSELPLLVEGPIVRSGGKLERLFDGGFWLDGVAEAPDGRIFFSDITISFAANNQAGHIWYFDPGSNQTTLFRSPSGMANGIAFDSTGRMLVAEGADHGGRRVTATDLATGKALLLAAQYQGRPFNAPNDIAFDQIGRVYFTDPRYLGHESIDQPVFGVYRVDPDCSIHLVLADVFMPNGIAISPDARTLYISEVRHLVLDPRIDSKATQHPGGTRILAYDLRADGTATNRRVFLDFGLERGPDALRVDENGNLYGAVMNADRHGIAVYTPQAAEIAFIPTPVPAPSLALTRHSGTNYLYITAQTNLYRIPINVKGYSC